MSLSKVLSRNIKRTITKKVIYLTTKRPYINILFYYYMTRLLLGQPYELCSIYDMFR